MRKSLSTLASWHSTSLHTICVRNYHLLGTLGPRLLCVHSVNLSFHAQSLLQTCWTSTGTSDIADAVLLTFTETRKSHMMNEASCPIYETTEQPCTFSYLPCLQTKSDVQNLLRWLVKAIEAVPSPEGPTCKAHLLRQVFSILDSRLPLHTYHPWRLL